jgi:hypothetical protein
MRLFIIALSVLLFGCVEKKRDIDKKYNFISYNQKSGIVSIDYGKLKGRKIKRIDIISNSEFSKQGIFVDSNLQLYKVSNYKDVFWKENYENSWISFDQNGIFDFSESYFYETFLEYTNDTLFIECRFQKPLLKGRQFIVVGDLSSDYKIKGDVDTFYFDKQGLVKFPDINAKLGQNTIKFIIVDEQRIDKILNQRYIYASKTYFYKE